MNNTITKNIVSYIILTIFIVVFFLYPFIKVIQTFIINITSFSFKISEYFLLIENSLILCISIPIILLIALPLCYRLYLNKKKTDFSLFLFLIPYVIPISIVGFCSYLFFAYNGPLYNFISFFTNDLVNIDLLSYKWFSMLIIIITMVIVSIGECIIFLNAEMSKIPYSIIETAKIDGCSEFEIIFKIIIPNMYRSIIAYSLIIISWIVTSAFALITKITGGGPGGSTMTFDYHIIKNYFLSMDSKNNIEAYFTSLILLSVYALIGIISFIIRRIRSVKKNKN